MNTLTIRNFRSFADLIDIPIRPLTLLVGENSTGKSSFMAAIRLAWDIAYARRRVDFNEEPFLLGAFDQIAHFRGGRAGRAETFELAFSSQAQPRRRTGRSVDVCHGAEFRSAGSHPIIQKQFLRSGRCEFTATFPEGHRSPKINVKIAEKSVDFSLGDRAFPLRVSAETPLDWTYLLHALLGMTPRPTGNKTEEHPFSRAEWAEIQQGLLNTRLPIGDRPIAMAPVRTRPQRTYNPISEAPLPEGDHIPMVLAKTFFEDKDRWMALKEALNRFGKEAGLFSSIDIKALGRSESDPFQVRVKIEGPPSNLVDVGYGVSQVLPILVDSLLTERGNFYLLQQPEVHLHPRAQAALGSFFANLAGNHSKQFVIETHSDYMVDRIRMEIRDRSVVKPEDVSILFFERQGVEVSVFSINLDSSGNLIDVPASYRRFFLSEERRFLGGI